MRRYYCRHKIYEIFKKPKYWQIKTDIFRYCILFERGGFWLDIKSIIDVSLSKILKRNASMIFSYEKNKFSFSDNYKIRNKLLYKNNVICNWFLGSAKNNIILEDVINNICKNYPKYKNKVFDNPKDAILNFSGPILLTKTIRKFFYHRNNNFKIQQTGIDIYGYGRYHASELGSLALFKMKKHYSLDKFSKIIN
jgi:mannosyltransferase OCH1-like enzyme